jgi:hypothetical protein
MSRRQYSYAAAGVAIATNATAKNAAAGATRVFKSCFIFFSLCVLVFSPGTDMGCRLGPRHQHRKKAKEFSVELNKRPKSARCEVLKYNHHLIIKHDRHARIMQRSAVQKSVRGLTLKQGGYARPDGKLSVIRGWACDRTRRLAGGPTAPLSRCGCSARNPRFVCAAMHANFTTMLVVR